MKTHTHCPQQLSARLAMSCTPEEQQRIAPPGVHSQALLGAVRPARTRDLGGRLGKDCLACLIYCGAAGRLQFIIYIVRRIPSSGLQQTIPNIPERAHADRRAERHQSWAGKQHVGVVHACAALCMSPPVQSKLHVQACYRQAPHAGHAEDSQVHQDSGDALPAVLRPGIDTVMEEVCTTAGTQLRSAGRRC